MSRDIHALGVVVLELRDARHEVRLGADEALDLDPTQSLDEDADVPVGVLEHFEDAGRASTGEQFFRCRAFVLGGALRNEPDHAVAHERLLDEGERRIPRDQKRDNRCGEDDDAAQRKDRKLVGDRHFLRRFVEGEPAGFLG